MLLTASVYPFVSGKEITWERIPREISLRDGRMKGSEGSQKESFSESECQPYQLLTVSQVRDGLKNTHWIHNLVVLGSFSGELRGTDNSFQGVNK